VLSVKSLGGKSINSPAERGKIMGTEEQILDHQLTHGVFDNATFAGAEGIAKRAVAQGFSTLSHKQQLALEQYLSKTCSGITDPGGHHNECAVELKGKELLDAYQRLPILSFLFVKAATVSRLIMPINGKEYLKNK
jgi:hypothetical protein